MTGREQCRAIERYYGGGAEGTMPVVRHVCRTLGITQRSWMYWRSGKRPMPMYIRTLITMKLALIRRLDDGADICEQRFLREVLGPRLGEEE
jgi:hypothetical protein